MKTKSALYILIALFAAYIGFFQKVPQAVAAPSLQLSPTAVTVGANTNTTLTVNIQTETTQVFGSDAIISYPSTLVDIVSVTNGNFFTDFTYSVANGTLEIHGYFASLYDFKAGGGTLATVVVKPKQSGSTATLALVCNSSSQTSQIINSQGQNILTCGNVNQTVITSPANPTATRTPTPTNVQGQPSNTPNKTPTPTTAGYVNKTPNCTNLAINPNSGYKPLTINLSCTGSDADNDIVSAQFNFGNGSTVEVFKNIGQAGSITTSYTYSTAGSYVASCKVKDNNQKFSDVPDICKKTVSVSTRPLASGPTATRTPTRAPTGFAGTSNPSPTVGFGSHIVLQPYATSTPFPPPEGEPEPTTTPKKFALQNFTNIWIVGAVLAVFILILMLLRYLGRKPEGEV